MHAYIVHNTTKPALDQLSVDVESTLLKVYTFFSTTAKRRESLKEFCAFDDVEFHETVCHAVTRWVQLNLAITRLPQNWTPLKSYFLSIGDDCPRHLQALLRMKGNSAGIEKADLVEVYLLFGNRLLTFFEQAVMKLKLDDTTSADLYAIMHSFLRR